MQEQESRETTVFGLFEQLSTVCFYSDGHFLSLSAASLDLCDIEYTCENTMNVELIVQGRSCWRWDFFPGGGGGLQLSPACSSFLLARNSWPGLVYARTGAVETISDSCASCLRPAALSSSRLAARSLALLSISCKRSRIDAN